MTRIYFKTWAIAERRGFRYLLMRVSKTLDTGTP
jgi:hypothetical protein